MRYKSVKSPLFNVFKYGDYPPSIANLSPALTINGTTVYPTLRYKGGDATATTWAPWGYGETLTLQSGTAPSYNQGSPLLGSLDDSVKFNGGGYYTGGTSIGTITTHHFAIEIIIEVSGGGTLMVLSKRKAGTLGGWWVYASAGYLTLGVRDDGGAGDTDLTSDYVGIGNIVYAIAFINPAENSTKGSRWFINGAVDSVAATNFSAVGSITSEGYLSVGSQLGTPASGVSVYDKRILYCSMWQCLNWNNANADTAIAEWATIAAERFAKLTGIQPNKATGSSTPTFTRATSAYLDKIEGDGTRKLYQVGAGWPRSCSRADSSTGRVLKGYLAEQTVQNVIVQSYAFDTTWAATNATVPTTSVICPDGIARTTSTLHEDATAGDAHYIQTNAVAVTSGATWVMSVFVKAANRDWVQIGCNALNTGNCYFDLTNGVVGTVSGTNAVGGMEYWGNGWYRCWVSSDASSTSNSLPALICASDDATNVFDGANQDSTYIFGMQYELGTYPTSYVPTTTAAVTRNADVLTYVGTNNVNVSGKQGRLQCSILAPSYNQAASDYAICDIHDGSADNRITLSTNDDVVAVDIVDTATPTVDIDSPTDVVNGVIHVLETKWRPDSIGQYVDGFLSDSDTSCTIPTGMTTISIGSLTSSTNQFNGLISDLKIWQHSKK